MDLQVRTHWLVTSLILSWSVTEVRNDLNWYLPLSFNNYQDTFCCEHLWVKLMAFKGIVLSYSITFELHQVIRYFFFGVKEVFGSTPRPLLWLRFFLLFPSLVYVIWWSSPMLVIISVTWLSLNVNGFTFIVHAEVASLIMFAIASQ